MDIMNDKSKQRMNPMITGLKVLSNDVFLQKLFRYFNLKDLKNIRLVCSLWKRLSEPVFRKRAQVVVILDTAESSVDRFQRLFGDPECESNFSPFTALKLHCSLPLHHSKLTDFFFGEGRCLTNLTLSSSTFRDENGKIFNVNKLIGPNLRKLDLCSKKTTLIVSTDRLTLVKYITLTDCTLDLNGGIMFPIMLEFDNMAFTKNGKSVTTVNMGEFVNYKGLEILRIFNSISLQSSTEFLLDSNKPPTLKKLVLCKVKVQDWQWVTWKVEELRTIYMNWDKKTRMDIEKLIITHTSSVDLSVLPEAVEKMMVMDGKLIQSRESLNLHKLEFVCLVGDFVNLKYFTNCPKLNSLELTSNNIHGEKISMEFVPKGLKRLILGGKISFDDGPFLHLEQLTINIGFEVIINYPLEEVLRKWNPRKLIIIIKRNTSVLDEWITPLITKSFASGIGINSGETGISRKLWIGPFLWLYETDFQRFSQQIRVDTQSSFYCFENGKGRAVRKSDIPAR